MKCKCYPNISSPVFDVYFYFTTSSTLFNIRNVAMTIRGSEEINNVEFTAHPPHKLFIADDYYPLKTKLLLPYSEMPTDWYYLRLSKNDFPLHIAVTLLIDNPNNPKETIPGYGTPTILSIPTPGLANNDKIHFVIQYHINGNKFTVLQETEIEPEAIVKIILT